MFAVLDPRLKGAHFTKYWGEVLAKEAEKRAEAIVSPQTCECKYSLMFL